MSRGVLARALLRGLAGNHRPQPCASLSYRYYYYYSGVVVRGFDAEARYGVVGGWRRLMSGTSAAAAAEDQGKKKEEEEGKKEVVVSSYWGISRPKITREDGTEWPWNCFMVFIFISLL